MAEKLKIKIRYFSDDIPRLKQIYPGEWIDISCPNDIVLLKNQPLLINLGFAMELPNDYEAIMAQRSSTYLKYGTILTNGIGVIDNSYKGNNDQWKALVYATQDCVIFKGTRILQFRIIKNQPDIEFEEVEDLENGDRGGFGSTGV